MPVIGIDLTDREPRVLVVDEQGRVVGRAGTKGSAAGIASPDGTASMPVPGVARVTLSVAGAAAVVAETWVGAARGAQNAICLVVGEQVFAGLMLDGRPWTGAHHRAGAAAWLAVNPVERQDYRKFGSLAAEVSSKGVARRLSWRIQSGDQSAVLERAGDLDAITAQHVFDGARAGDGVAISVVRDTARYIGMAVATLAAAIDPEIVVVGGSVAAAADLLLDPVRQECARRLSPEALADLRVEFSALGADATAIGAARLAMLAPA
ncbi:MAG: ROK family protein [Vicinamibacterales bacterium]